MRNSENRTLRKEFPDIYLLLSDLRNSNRALLSVVPGGRAADALTLMINKTIKAN